MGSEKTLRLPVFVPDFHAGAHAALHDATIQAAVGHAVTAKDEGRRKVVQSLTDYEAHRELAGQIKRHTLDHLPDYLEQLEQNVRRHGGKVHFAATAKEANEIIAGIARQADAKNIVKSKSMVSEETELNHALEAAGCKVVETDLGELIVQLGGDHPSHLVMPIIHKNAAQIGRIFNEKFGIPYTENPQQLAEVARVHLRNTFRQADMGISGVNFAVAETGSIVLCTNEGNGRMCTSWPRVHVALMGMEKVIPKLEHLPVFLKLLARSATGMPLTQYTSIITGPRRAGEHDGPEEFHLVILDNGRSHILASEYRDTLKCIRCGACLNACPVYRKVGGHTYGSVYPGPIGALLTPLFNGLAEHEHLPHATSLCGACYGACPVKINIPEMLIHMKADQVKQHIRPWHERMIFRLWTMTLSRVWMYSLSQKMQQVSLHLMARGRPWITRLPGPASGWTQVRDFPAPPAKNFRQFMKEHRAAQQKGGKSRGS